MAVQKINIEDFSQMAKTHLVLDVRSPSEFVHAHIPSAKSLPLFTDAERKVVGTAYKQQSREIAIKIGLDYFGPKMRSMVEEVEQLTNVSEHEPHNTKKVLVHCWRGGMRSGGVAWLLDLYGFQVYMLEGGYKVYRNWILQQFEKPYHFNIIGGYTGSGKTLILDELCRKGHKTVDLEALANHKGSALGAIGQEPQPSQEMFENLLGEALRETTTDTIDNTIFLEDESQRIGNLQIPPHLWQTMQKSNVYFMDIPFEERLNYLTEEYGVHPQKELVNAILRIQKRLGGLETKNSINHLIENNHKECFRILLKYYDKWYAKGLYNRANAQEVIKIIVAQRVNTEQNVQLLVDNL
ncbi:MAG: tRNA 2-selenouridine(34) synthase MnmH [Bacteroidota bacterium]